MHSTAVCHPYEELWLICLLTFEVLPILNEYPETLSNSCFVEFDLVLLAQL